MAMAAESSSVWDSVMEFTKTAQATNMDPVHWAVQLGSTLTSAEVSLPSIELAHLLVSHICWDNHVPITWKFLEKAITFNMAPPMLLLALLSTRVIPYRRQQPTAYRLYLELLKRYGFSLGSNINVPNYPKIMRSINDVLHLSEMFGVQGCEPGHLLVEYVFSVVWQLVDASMDDERLLELTAEKKSRWLCRLEYMEIDANDSSSKKRSQHHEVIRRENTKLSLEIVGKFLRNKVTSKILYLAHRNMPSQWGSFMQHLHLLVAKSVALRNSNCITPEEVLQLTSDSCKDSSFATKTKSQEQFCATMTFGPYMSSTGQCRGASWSALWLPVDLFLEDAMDGSQVAATGAYESLTSLVKALQAVNGTTWHDTFLGLWISSLRLVQRERNLSEGPVPTLDTRLSLLFSITTLAVADIIDEEEGEFINDTDCNPSNQRMDKQILGERREALATSLQQLGDYESLLTPPPSVSLAANQAAAKAIILISGTTVNNYNDCLSTDDMPNCSGNMRHLIVESCIARKILDTSAYFWPGYVSGSSSQLPHGVSNQMPSWSSFMKGAPLTPAMVSALTATPASSLAEIEKVYKIAISGSDNDKISAATILCGASLIRGWNIQEHILLFIIRLLSPLVPTDQPGTDGNFISFAPLLNSLLLGISSLDCVHIFSLHGLVPHLAAVLMPICEVSGSQIPDVSWALPTGENLCCHAVFSNAFSLLLRLWRFYHVPIEHVKGDLPPVGSQLTPEYLLLIRNSRLATFGNLPKDWIKMGRLSNLLKIPVDSVLMDSFPKLKRWHHQNLECIASTLSGAVNGNSAHQIVDALLNMMFRKINRGTRQLTSSTSGSSNSAESGSEDIKAKLKVPAWDILEAAPYVLDAALTACANGRLSPRDLVTGLRELADFLPATLATIVSYFSAEVTRGVWKPASMNGQDWPSPAARLSIIEQQIKKILAATGVDVPTLAVGGSSPATLPLPLAALVSLTITYRLDKSSERFLTLAGPALNSLAAGCPWPSFPIIASLWSQKAKRWSDYLVFSSSHTVFHHNNNAVVQLLKSCFTSTLGLHPSNITTHGGVDALLGRGFGSQFSGGMSPVSPGIFYLRAHESVRDVMFISEEIVSLLMLSVRDIASSGLVGEKPEKLKSTRYGSRYDQVSLAAAMVRARLAASLGASLLWITGGSSLVQTMLNETLPSWFLSVQNWQPEGDKSGCMISMLVGHALAYFAVLCGTFAWGVDSTSLASKRRAKVLGAHLEFLINALHGKISLGCDQATWRAYVSGFLSLMVHCLPKWMSDVDVNMLKRLSEGLRQWDEESLALALLGVGGVDAMGAAAELIIETGS